MTRGFKRPLRPKFRVDVSHGGSRDRPRGRPAWAEAGRLEGEDEASRTACGGCHDRRVPGTPVGIVAADRKFYPSLPPLTPRDPLESRDLPRDLARPSCRSGRRRCLGAVRPRLWTVETASIVALAYTSPSPARAARGCQGRERGANTPCATTWCTRGGGTNGTRRATKSMPSNTRKRVPFFRQPRLRQRRPQQVAQHPLELLARVRQPGCRQSPPWPRPQLAQARIELFQAHSMGCVDDSQPGDRPARVPEVRQTAAHRGPCDLPRGNRSILAARGVVDERRVTSPAPRHRSSAFRLRRDRRPSAEQATPAPNPTATAANGGQRHGAPTARRAASFSPRNRDCRGPGEASSQPAAATAPVARGASHLIRGNREFASAMNGL